MENKQGQDENPGNIDHKQETIKGKRPVGEGQENSAVQQNAGIQQNYPRPETTEKQWETQDEFIDMKKPNTNKE